MSLIFEGVEPDQYGRYIIPFRSKILEKEVTITIPTENGTIEAWQLALVNQFEEREEELKESVYKTIFEHYQEEADNLRLKFGKEYQHLVRQWRISGS